MVFNATFNNISAISWQSVLLVEETTDLPQVTEVHYKVTIDSLLTQQMTKKSSIAYHK